MSDESGDQQPSDDPWGGPVPADSPTTDPWGNPLPPGTVQQPPRSAIPPPSPGYEPPPPTPPPAGSSDGTSGADGPPAGQAPGSWWPADPAQQDPQAPPPTGTDAWGRPLAGQQPPGQQPPPGFAQQTYPGQPQGAHPPGYPYPGYPVHPAPKNVGTAIGALVCGILSILCAGYLGIVLGPVALGLGLASRRKIARSAGQLKGTGLATAAVVLGSIGVVLSIVWIIFMINNPNYLEDLLNELTTTTTQG